MSAITAEPLVTTKKTLITDIARGAGLPIPRRIDEYIKHRLMEASSEELSAVKHSIEAVRRHGFTACANLQLAEYLEAYRSTPLREHYELEYPQCCFLPWQALQSLLKSLNLWCDLPEYYAGAIPPEQLPWLDVFALSSDDCVNNKELSSLVADTTTNWSVVLRMSSESYLSRDDFTYDHRLERFVVDMSKILRQFKESWFVIAPRDAFTSNKDFISRAREVTTEKNTSKTNPPNDPIIIRFVKGGCLVVAAWGDEAKFINDAVARMNSIDLNPKPNEV